MTNRTQYQQREISILHAIVESYIDSGEPVASRTLSRSQGGGLSAATIRNVMADLYEDGFLSQPHTSAGRVPTVKAIQNYVQTLSTPRLPANELNRVRTELRRAESMEERIERSSHLLTEMTRNVGISAAIPGDAQKLRHVELLLLADRRVLMVVETEDRIVRNRVVPVEENLSQDALNDIRNYLNQNFAGWVFSAIQTELRSRLDEERALYDALLQRLELLYQKGLLDMGMKPEVHLEGTSNLVTVDLQLNRDRLRDLFRTLEEKQRLLQLLERFFEESRGGVAVQVGLGEIHPSMQELSLIGITVTLPTGLSARFAVLGPMRMNYEQVMSAVYHVGETVQHLSNS